MKRKVAIFVLVVVFVLSTVCLVACDEREGNDDIFCVITSPSTKIVVNMGDDYQIIELSDVEIISQNRQDNPICGKFNAKITENNQVTTDVEIAFRQQGTDSLFEITDNTTGKTTYYQTNAQDLMDYLQSQADDNSSSTGESLEISDEQLQQLTNSLQPIITKLEESIEQLANEFNATLLSNFFEKKGSNQYVFAIEKVKNFSDDLYNLPLKEVISKYFGDGSDDYTEKVKDELVTLLHTPMEDVLDMLKEDGITPKMLADCADEFIKIISDNQVSSLGELFGSPTTSDYLQSDAFCKMKLQQFLANFGISITTANIDNLFAQLDNTLYQFIFGKDSSVAIQSAYDEMSEFLDELGNSLDLTIKAKKGEIKLVDLSYEVTDIEMDVPTEEGNIHATIDFSTEMIVDKDEKQVSDFDYDSIGKGWYGLLNSSDDILIANGFAKGYWPNDREYSLSEYCQYEKSGYIQEYNVIVDGRITETKSITPKVLLAYQMQESCNGNLFVTGFYVSEVSVSKRFFGTYVRANYVEEGTYVSEERTQTEQTMNEYSVFVNTQTGQIYSPTKFADTVAVHGKDNLRYNGNVVECLGCHNSWECDHGDMAITNVTLSNSNDCAQGSTVTYRCEGCGFEEQSQTNEHLITYQTTELPLDVSYSTQYIEYGKCACGKVADVQFISSCRYTTAKSYYIDQNGLSHSVTRNICSCSVLWIEDTYKKYDDCTVENYKFTTISVNGKILLENYGGLESVTEEHQLQVTYQDTNNDCSDGYTVVEQCANCDYQNSYWSIGHVRQLDYLFKDEPDCYDGIIMRESCAICGKIGSDIGRYGHVQLPSETIVDANNHSVTVMYCLCGGSVDYVFCGEHTVNKTVTEDLIEIIYTVENCNMTVTDRYQCISKEDRQYSRNITIYEGDQLLWQKSYSIIIDHDCTDFTQWTDYKNYMVCSQGCLIRHTLTMHQYYEMFMAEVTQGFDVCEGHSAILCSCAKCSDEEFNLFKGDATQWYSKINSVSIILQYYSYDYYECADCGLGFLVQKFKNNTISSLECKIFVGMDDITITKDGQFLRTIDSSVFAEFAQTTS